MYKTKKMNDGSWVSHFIVPSSSKALSPATASKSRKLEAVSSQQVFSQRIVPSSSDPRCFLLVTKSFLFHDMDPVFFDPELDPPYKACFNCWEGDQYNKKTRHNHFTCGKPQQREFCENCGRQGVDVRNCPRCARGFLEWERTRCFGGKFVSRWKRDAGLDTKCEETMDGSVLESGEDGFERRDFEKEIRDGSEKGHSDTGALDEGSASKGENCDVEGDDEDYEELIVDEEERSESPSSTNDTIRDFIQMMDAVKLLPIQTQSNVVLKFAKKRREQGGQNGWA